MQKTYPHLTKPCARTHTQLIQRGTTPTTRSEREATWRDMHKVRVKATNTAGFVTTLSLSLLLRKGTRGQQEIEHTYMTNQ